MAVKLTMDAVRLVLTQQHELARTYFDAARALSLAAVELEEKWIYTDLLFARCEALRIHALACWALDVDGKERTFLAALDAWTNLAAREIEFDPNERNAHAIASLISAHHGDYAKAASLVASIQGCHRTRAWCQLRSLLLSVGIAMPNKQEQWNALWSTFVVSSHDDELVSDNFNVGEACMIANVLSLESGLVLTPFETIGLLRGN